MKSLNQLDIDGKQLLLLLTIYDSGSLSNAAQILELNQSTVSYWLERLRTRFNDPLFVREGQGVVATPRTESLIPKARDLIKGLSEFVESEKYIPENDDAELTIAANSAERDVLIKPFFEKILSIAPKLQLQIKNTGSAYQLAEELRHDTVDFAIFPAGLLEGEGLMQKVIVRAHDVIYSDPNFGPPPATIEQYCQRPHAKIAFGPSKKSGIDKRLKTLNLERNVRLQVSDFESLATLIRGTDTIATLPSFCKMGIFKDFQITHVPWEDTKLHLAIFWNARNNHSPRMKYWRELFINTQCALQTKVEQVEQF